jgi:hypothetical protein
MATAQDVGGGQFPESGESDGQPPRCDGTAVPGALGISRHVHHEADVGRRDDLRYQLRRLLGQTAPPLLLPRANEGTGALVVHDRRTGASEGETTACALGAPPHRPRARRAAALAHRRAQADECIAARLAERGAGSSAYGAALREEELEHVVAIVDNYV